MCGKHVKPALRFLQMRINHASLVLKPPELRRNYTPLYLLVNTESSNGCALESVQLAPAFHLGEQSNCGLLHSDERLGRKLTASGPRVKFGYRLPAPDRPGLARAAQRAEDLAALGQAGKPLCLTIRHDGRTKLCQCAPAESNQGRRLRPPRQYNSTRETPSESSGQSSCESLRKPPNNSPLEPRCDSARRSRCQSRRTPVRKPSAESLRLSRPEPAQEPQAMSICNSPSESL